MTQQRQAHHRVHLTRQLTPRQREVPARIAIGQTNREIADALGISFDGVKWHVSEILSRLDVAAREEAEVLATACIHGFPDCKMFIVSTEVAGPRPVEYFIYRDESTNVDKAQLLAWGWPDDRTMLTGGMADPVRPGDVRATAVTSPAIQLGPAQIGRGVFVEVLVGGTGVFVDVFVGVAVFVGVEVSVAVAVAVDVLVGVAVSVGVAVFVDVFVGVAVAVGVGVFSRSESASLASASTEMIVPFAICTWPTTFRYMPVRVAPTNRKVMVAPLRNGR